ncbi:MAG: adenylate/guanylate cyclase domain-containing protein [Acidimicrobiales bacterium]
MQIPSVHYATSADGLSIAYQIWGTDGPCLMLVPGLASHLEIAWEIPADAAIFNRLGSHFKVITFDKRGTGLSDRQMGTGSLEARADDIRVVLDAAGVKRTSLLAISEGGALAMMFAATNPERVDRLVLIATFADVDRSPEPADFDYLENNWGSGLLMQQLWYQGAPDSSLPLLGRFERAMASPRAITEILRHNSTLDVSSLASTVQAPTCVVHAVGDPVVPFEKGVWLAENIPNATLVRVEGDFHGSSNLDEMDLVFGPAVDFLAGRQAAQPALTRRLAAVLMNDIVDSTRTAQRLGDQRWTERLNLLEQEAQLIIQRHRGDWIKSTGDGLLATLDGPGVAIDAGLEIADLAQSLSLTLRSGVHFGEIELRGDDIGGLGVHLTARVMSAASGGELWVSSTVPGLAIGSGHVFETRGFHTLKGIEGQWELFRAARQAEAP